MELVMEFRRDWLGKTGAEICMSRICSMANSADFSILRGELDAVVSDKDCIRQYEMLVSACAVYLGYLYKCEEYGAYPHWDARNRAAKQFCYEHYDYFCEMFRMSAGFEFPLRKEKACGNYWKDSMLGAGHTRGMKISEEVWGFTQAHPTIQQRVMEAMLQGLQKTGLLLGAEVRFPFI